MSFQIDCLKPVITSGLLSVPMAGVEPARLLGTAPSRQRVYQFHHIGTYCWKTWSVPLFTFQENCSNLIRIPGNPIALVYFKRRLLPDLGIRQGQDVMKDNKTEKWCRWPESNRHAFWALPPQDSVSTNSTTSARIVGKRGLSPFLGNGWDIQFRHVHGYIGGIELWLLNRLLKHRRLNYIEFSCLHAALLGHPGQDQAV